MEGKGHNSSINGTVSMASSPGAIPTVMKGKGDGTAIHSMFLVPLSPSLDPGHPVPTVIAEGANTSTHSPENPAPIVIEGDHVSEAGSGPYGDRVMIEESITNLHSQDISVYIEGNNNLVHVIDIGVQARVLEILSNHSEHNAKLNSSTRSTLLKNYEGNHKSFLDSAMNWISDPDSNNLSEKWKGKRMLWVSGPAGVGKSAFAQHLGEMCIKNNVFGGGFFFSGQNNFNLTLTVFPTIAYQLFAKNTAYKKNVMDLLQSDPTALQTNLQSQFQDLIVNSLAGITLPDQKRLVIIIDGLDECANAHSQDDITELISGVLCPQANALELPVLWVVCSRNAYSLKQNQDILDRCHFHMFDLDSKESKEGVTRFIHESLKVLYGRRNYVPKPQWPGKEAVDMLCEVSSGFIAFPATLFRYIDDTEIDRPDVILNEALMGLDGGKNAEGITKKAPWTVHLDSIYKRILDNISRRKVLLENSLWIVHTLAMAADDGNHLLQSNNMQQYSNILGLDKARLYASLGKLHAVLKIPDAKDSDKYNLTFHHASFSDFLHDPRRSKKYSINDNQIKDKVFSRAIEILKSDIPLASISIAKDGLKNVDEQKGVNELKAVERSKDEVESKDVDPEDADESLKRKMYLTIIRPSLSWPDPNDDSCWKLAIGVTESAIRAFFILLNDNLERQNNFNFNLFAYLICGWRLPVSFLFAIGRTTLSVHESVDRRLSRLRRQYHPRAVPMSKKWLEKPKTKPSYICLGNGKNSVLAIVLPAQHSSQSIDRIGFIATQEPRELWRKVYDKTTEAEYSNKINVLWKANLEA